MQKCTCRSYECKKKTHLFFFESIFHSGKVRKPFQWKDFRDAIWCKCHHFGRIFYLGLDSDIVWVWAGKVVDRRNPCTTWFVGNAVCYNDPCLFQFFPRFAQDDCHPNFVSEAMGGWNNWGPNRQISSPLILGIFLVRGGIPKLIKISLKRRTQPVKGRPFVKAKGWSSNFNYSGFFLAASFRECFSLPLRKTEFGQDTAEVVFLQTALVTQPWGSSIDLSWVIKLGITARLGGLGAKTWGPGWEGKTPGSKAGASASGVLVGEPPAHVLS